MKHDIFISYSRRDSNEVKALKSLIENRIPHIRIWFDETGIESGDEFQDKIVDAIDNCEVVLFMLSENSLNSEWPKDEVMYAKETEKRIIPVLLKGAVRKGWFLLRFGRLDYIDSSVEASVNKMLSNLASAFPAPKEGNEIQNRNNRSKSDTNTNTNTTPQNQSCKNTSKESSQPQDKNKDKKNKKNNQPHLTKEMLGFDDATFAEYIRATDGDGEAMYRLAQLYSTGKGMKKPNTDKYVYWLKRAADKGIIESYEELAKINDKGGADLIWLQKAYDAYKTRAQDGDVDSMYELSRIIEFYFDYKWEEKMYWEEKAAENGHPEAMYYMYLRLHSKYQIHGHVTNQELETGLEYLRKAWNKGSQSAHKAFDSYKKPIEEIIEILKRKYSNK